MAILVEQLVQNIADSGLMSAEEVGVFIESLPADEPPVDGESLARAMTAAGRLTPYQAEVLCRGETTGLVFDQYVVLEKIGQGGMGVVVKARHRRMDRMVAVKKLAAEGLKSDDAVQRFEREVRAVAKLQHPNIVAAFDSREQDGVQYLILEYVEGRDLSDMVAQDGPLPVERAVDYMLQAARGLAYAHKRGIIHRDIKPGNLLVDEEGTVKVLDMGLALIEEVVGGDSPTLEHLTSDGQVMGTSDYMAPEQAKNAKAADQRSDIYSLGCTFYRLLTGDAPYSAGSGGSNMMVIFAHMEQEIPSLTEKRSDVSPEIAAIYRRMLAKAPADRYQTMKEVIAAFEATRGGDSPSDSLVHTVAPDEELSSFFEHVHDDPSSVSTIGKRGGMSGIGSRGGRSGLGKRGSGVRKRDKKSAAKTAETAAQQKSKPAGDTVERIAQEDTQRTAAGREVAGATQAEPESRRRVPTRKRQQHRMTIIIGAVAAACVLGAVIVGMMLYMQTSVGTVVVKTEDKGVRVLVTRDGQTVAQIDARAGWQAELESGEYVVSLEGGSDDLTLDKGTITVARGSEVHLAVTQRSAAAAPDPGLAIRSGEWVDLFYHIDPQEDVRQGEWSLDDGCLSCRWGDAKGSYGEGFVRLPVRLKGSYDLRIVGDMLVGDMIYLPGPSGHGLCGFFPVGTSLIARVEGFERLLTPSSASVGNGEQRHVEISVDVDGKNVAITAKGDNNTYVDWRGLTTELNLLAGDPHAAGAVVLATDNSPVRYRQIQIRVHGSEGQLLRPAVASTETDEDRALSFGDAWNWLRTPVVYDGSHPITIEAWVDSRSAVSETQCIVSDSGGRGVLSLEMLKGGFFLFALRDRQDQWQKLVPEWTSLYDHFHHVAAVYDGSQMRIYVDGRERGSAECAGVHDNIVKSPLMIGATPQSDSDFLMGKKCFVGLIDEVRISSTARYTKDFQPPERFESDQDTLALYHLDEVAGGIAHDASDHKRHGTIIGAKHVPPASAVPRSRSLVYPPTASQPLPNGWRIGEPVNLGPHINQAGDDSTPFLTEDGLTLIYRSDRPGGQGEQGDQDLWVCTRKSPNEPFGEPVNLGPGVNGPSFDSTPALSADGLTLVFTSRRSGITNHDIYICSRKTATADFDEPMNLNTVNSGNTDDGPKLAADGLTLMFHSDRGEGEGYGDLWQSTRLSLDEEFGKPVNLGPIVNTQFGEGNPELSADGRTLVFDSSRRGGRGKADLWLCTRKSASEKFGPPVNLGPNVNTAAVEGCPAFSESAQILVFVSDREGGFGKGDLYQAQIIRTESDQGSDGAESAADTDDTQDATPDEATPPPGAAGTDPAADSVDADDDAAEMTDGQELTSDRDVARWVIAKLGGSVSLKTGPDEGGETIRDEQDLPADSFQLFSIALAETGVSDQDLEQLPTLSELRELHLNNTKVTAAGLAALKPLPHLYLLQLTGSQVADSGLAGLDKFPVLETLVLRGTAVTDAGVTQLAQNPTIKRVDLQDTKITDAALAALATLPRLNVLSLRRTAISDEGIEHLHGKKDLVVALGDTQVTAAGREELAKALTGNSQVID